MKYIFFILSILASLAMYSQEIINEHRFLEISLSLLDQQASSSIEEIDLPWVESIQLRTETRDMDFGKQEYTLRVSPNTISKRNAQKQYIKSMQQGMDWDKEKVKQEQIQQVYEDWLSLYLIDKQLNLHEEMQQILVDKKTIINEQLNAYTADYQRIIKMTTAVNDEKIKVIKLESQKKDITSDYNLANSQFDFSQLISVDNLASRVMIAEYQNNRISDQKREFEEKILLSEINLEETENKQIFDFAQIKYQGPNNNPLNEKISFGLGFQLSNSSKSKIKLKELQWKLDQLKNETDFDRIRKKAKVEYIKAKLLTHLEVYEQSRDIQEKERMELKSILQVAMQQEGFNPLDLLDIEVRQLNNQYALLTQEQNIYTLYLDYLKDCNLLYQNKFSQYLLK